MKARIFGAGSIGNHLSNALRKLKYEIEVIDIDKSALLRMRNDIYPSRYGEWDNNIKLLNEPSEELVDLEIIGTPPDTHSNILLDRLEKNNSRYWLVEKPFTIPSLKHIQELERKISKFKNFIFVGYNHSVSPAFITLLNDLKESNIPKKISCLWEEHWGGIFKAHPWLDGPKDSYLGFNKRGGGALMEHSHGLHLLTVLFDIFNFELKGQKATVIMDKEKNYDKKTYISFDFKNADACSFYSTDVITKNVKKFIEVETEDEFFSITFGSDNGTSDTYTKKSKYCEVMKKFKKTRADDFIYEMKLIDDLVQNKRSGTHIKNISCEQALKVAFICANILDNNYKE